MVNKSTVVLVLQAYDYQKWSDTTAVKLAVDLDNDGTYQAVLEGNHAYLRPTELIIVRSTGRLDVNDGYPLWEIVEEEANT